MIKVTHRFRVHAGGTKFYETVLFEREDGGPSSLIKRYGKMTEKKSGGQTKFEGYDTAAEAERAWREIWKQKDKPKEYSVSHDLEHGIATMIKVSGHDSLKQTTRAGVIKTAELHYGEKRGMELTIADHLRIMDKFDPNAGFEIPAHFEDEPVDRGDEYGSW